MNKNYYSIAVAIAVAFHSVYSEVKGYMITLNYAQGVWIIKV